jgi:hypothetical protein
MSDLPFGHEYPFMYQVYGIPFNGGPCGKCTVCAAGDVLDFDGRVPLAAGRLKTLDFKFR